MIKADHRRVTSGEHALRGLAARRLAVDLVAGVLVDRRPLTNVLADYAARPRFADLERRDRAFARAVATNVLRRQGELEYVLQAFLTRPLPPDKGLLWPILLCSAAQLLILDLPAHAVVDLAVEATRRDRGARRFAKLANAVLRRVAENGATLLKDQDRTRLNIPEWLWQRWSAAYGEPAARDLADASLREAPLDLTLKRSDDAPSWAARLNAHLLPTGSLRTTSAATRIEELPGYREGAWWVQDAAAALVVKLAGDVADLTVADLCAAPGGKTAQLAAAGARVTAVDISATRLKRVQENLNRLGLAAELVEADAAAWSPGRPFDVVILDAPCTATGTIRRHPDILRLKTSDDVVRMAELQRRLLDNAAAFVRRGGLLIYSTCSLEPAEGPLQVRAFLETHSGFRRIPVLPDAIAAESAWISNDGDLRTFPFHLPSDQEEVSGMDGFYAARLRRQA